MSSKASVVRPAYNVTVTSSPSLDTSSPVPRIFLYFGLILVFIRFSMIHQFLAFQMGINLYLLYVVGVPALFGVAVSGGLALCFKYRPTIYWTAFGLCATLACLFSTWRGGSVGLLQTYLRTDLVMLFVIAGLARTWNDCRKVMYAIAAGALFNVVSVRLFGVMDANDRTSMAFGSVSNSNDYAGHLILVLPIVYWVVMSSKNWFVKLSGVGIIGAGVFQILASGSRGAAIALALDVLFILVFGANLTQRIKLLMAVPVILVAAVAILPPRALQRVMSFSHEDASASVEALESSRIREYLLKESILITFQNPFLGVGPGQFSAYEGKKSTAEGGNFWYETHNSYTQVASECGIPAFVFWLAGIISPLFLLAKANRIAKGRDDMKDIASAVLCMRLAMVGFCSATLFLNFAYMFYQPAMAGLAIAIFHSTVNRGISSPEVAVPQMGRARFGLTPGIAAKRLPARNFI